eukprot:TRINITY_DN8204_c0_g2_i1.p2 TRINITY_DN8204_c0_g2~~TRINITY_DN8204_c0_g2_i1.p2  ORF type:complete len:182 (-),score=6.54 TRINITY_DN8204_c0_g2_i1:55-600(-)
MILFSNNMVKCSNSIYRPFQKSPVIQATRFRRRINVQLVRCRFSKQPSSAPRKKFDGGKTLIDSKTQLNKILTNNLRKCKDADKLLVTIQQNKLEMDCISIATAFVSIAYIIQYQNRRFNSKDLDDIRMIYLELFQLTEQHVDQMQGRSVSNVLWSIGKLVDIFGYKLIEEHEVKVTFPLT